jgi:manganese/iron transport system permease protein
VGFLTDPFTDPETQRAWLELALLCVPAGALGAFIVLRRLAFATHALGVGAFPGTILALGLGFSTFLGGLAAALVLAALLAVLQRRRDLDAAASTGLLLAGALAVGALLSTDVFALGSRDADAALFGATGPVSDAALAQAAAVAVASLLAVARWGRGWLVVAFEREHAPALGFAPTPLDLVLLGLLAATAVAALDAVGALLISSLLVVPAGAARLLTRRMVPFALCSSALALAMATAGLWLSVEIDVPHGAGVAAVAAAAFTVLLGWSVAAAGRPGALSGRAG